MLRNDENFVMLPVPVSMFAAVCAVLGGTSTLAIAAASPAPSPRGSTAVENGSTSAADPDPAEPANETVDTGSPDVDAAGWPWSPELHASTKGTTKDGLWRMKIGVARPEPKPGFPKAAAGEAGAASHAGSTAGAALAASPAAAAPAAGEDEDEFAAFRAAADAANATDASAAAAAPARKWTDADLGALTNQAAQKLGPNSVPGIKDIIAKFTPAGEVPHSRKIPADSREAFAKAIEAHAGIEFAG